MNISHNGLESRSLLRQNCSGLCPGFGLGRLAVPEDLGAETAEECHRILVATGMIHLVNWSVDGSLLF